MADNDIEKQRELRWIRNKTGEVIQRNPGSIKGTDCIIENLKDCEVYILDYTQQITVDDCEDCIFVLGPCDGSIFLRDSKNCTFYTASRQLRTRGVKNSNILMYAATNPAVESSGGLTVGTWNVAYPLLDRQFRQAKLNPMENMYRAIFDFTPNEEGLPTPHYVFMDESYQERYDKKIELEGFGPAVNPVNGEGTTEDDPSQTNEPHMQDGMMTFPIGFNGEDAKRYEAFGSAPLPPQKSGKKKKSCCTIS